jgi:hypothetical protein
MQHLHGTAILSKLHSLATHPANLKSTIEIAKRKHHHASQTKHPHHFTIITYQQIKPK